MYAIEFNATIQNGMIPIPKHYLKKLQRDLKVIVFQQEPLANNEKNTKKEEFLAGVARYRFDLPQDYRFNREELYDK